MWISVSLLLLPRSSCLKPSPSVFEGDCFSVHWHSSPVLRQTNFSNFRTLISLEVAPVHVNTSLTDQQVLVVLSHHQKVSVTYPAYKISALAHGTKGNTKSIFLLLQWCLMIFLIIAAYQVHLSSDLMHFSIIYLG